MGPMSGVSGEQDEEDDDKVKECFDADKDEEENIEAIYDPATNFTTEVHRNYFKEVLKSYGIDLKEWTVCQVRFFY